MADRRLLYLSGRDIPFFALYGLIGVAFNYAAYFYALRWTTVTMAVILLYTYPKRGEKCPYFKLRVVFKPNTCTMSLDWTLFSDIGH